MEKDFEIYLFDFDGCLVDTMKAMEFIFLESLKKCGLSAEKEEVKQFIRQPLPVTFKQKGGEDKDFSTFDYWINVYLKDEKATFVSLYGIDKAKKVARDLTDEALSELEVLPGEYGSAVRETVLALVDRKH